MKRKIAIVLALILAVSTLLLACGKDDPASAVIGTWKVTEIADDEYSLSELEETFGFSIEITLEFKEDGAVTFAAFGEAEEGTYEVKDNKVTLFYEGDEDSVLELDGDTMTMADESFGTMILEKQ